MDHSVWSFFVDHRPGWLVELSRALSFVGDETVLGPLTLVLLVWAVGTRRTTVHRVAPFVTMVSSYLVVGLAKVSIDRPRPPLVSRLVETTSASMPSGHAAYAAALATVAWMLLGGRPAERTGRALAVAAATAVGLSRLVLGVHWLSDVLVGWLAGAAVGACVVVLLRRRLQSSG